MVKKHYPMIDGGSIFRLSDIVVFWRRLLLKAKRVEGNAKNIDVSDNQKDALFDFDEFPVCELCNGSESVEVLKAVDGNRVVECCDCGLWFTSPRVNEMKWKNWLLEDNERNREFTENRLRHGMALKRNIPLSFSFWWRVTRYQRQKQLKKIICMHGGDVQRIFDVGCGCGYLLKAAQDMGMHVSGNDLNRYAVDRMRELFDFDVHAGILYDLVEKEVVKKSYFDVVYMNDYIEHSYHPKRDVGAAYEMLRTNGVIYLRTFCVNSERFAKLKEKWDMLMWNHCFHFSSDLLKRIIEDVGFTVVSCNVYESDGIVEICGRKSPPIL